MTKMYRIFGDFYVKLHMQMYPLWSTNNFYFSTVHFYDILKIVKYGFCTQNAKNIFVCSYEKKDSAEYTDQDPILYGI